MLASACSDGTVKLWGLDAGARAATAVASVASHPNALATATTFLPGGNLLASAGGDGKVVVCDVRASCKAVRRITPPCVATGLCVFVAPKTRVGVGGGAHDEHRECRIEGAPAEGTGYLAMCGRDGVVRAVPGEGAGPSGALRSTGTQSDLSETQTPLLCVASDRDGTRVFAAGNTRATREELELSAVRSNASNARDSSPFGRAPGPFGSLRGDASSLGAKPRAEPAEIFVWDARFGSPGKDEERS